MYMKVLRRLALLSVCVSSPLAFSAKALAQSNDSDAGKILVIEREMLKPGKAGAPHYTAESAFGRAVASNKADVHYTGLRSMTGPERALFLENFSSLAAWESAERAWSPAFSAAFDKAAAADGDLLSEKGQSVWRRRDDLSTNVRRAGKGARYLEISLYVGKPGRAHELEEMGKALTEAAAGNPDLHWTTYDGLYTPYDGPAYLVLTAYNSLAEADAAWSANAQMFSKMGGDWAKRVSHLEAESVEKEGTAIFRIDPKLSVPSAGQLAEDPEFWKPAASPHAAAAKAKAPAAPAGQ